MNADRLAGSAIAALVAAAAVIAAWLAEQQRQALIEVSTLPPPQASSALELRAMPAGEAWRRLAWQSARQASADSPPIEDLLWSIARHYPLEGWLWLRLAEISHGLERPAEATLPRLRAALRLSPYDAELNWRAALLQWQLGDAEAATIALRRMLAADRARLPTALGLALRWQPDPGALIDSLAADAPALLRAIVHWSARTGQHALADAALERLEATGIDPDTAGAFVARLLRDGDVDGAVAHWARVDAGLLRHGVPNADFELPLGRFGGFDWQGRVPDSVQVFRDTTVWLTPPASLAWRFDGRRNVDLDAPWLPIPVRPGGRYRLVAQWRGQGLRSASLPSFQLLSSDRRQLLAERTAPGLNWDWQEVVLEFAVPPGDRLVVLRLRRAPTAALDRALAGTVHLDRLRLQALDLGSEATARAGRAQ